MRRKYINGITYEYASMIVFRLNETETERKGFIGNKTCPDSPIVQSKSANFSPFLETIRKKCSNRNNYFPFESSNQCSDMPSIFLCRYVEIFFGLPVCYMPGATVTVGPKKIPDETIQSFSQSETFQKSSIVDSEFVSQTVDQLEKLTSSSESEISNSIVKPIETSISSTENSLETTHFSSEIETSIESSVNSDINTMQSILSSTLESNSLTLGPDTAQIRPTSVLSNSPSEKMTEEVISVKASTSENVKTIDSTVRLTKSLEENVTLNSEEAEKNSTEQHIYADETKDWADKSVEEAETEEETVKLPYDKKLAAVNRLRSKIKELELDLHLTSRYLEELSQRYKKKMEETHQMLNSKIINMTKAFTVREQKQKEQIERSHREIIALKFIVRNATMLLEKAHLRIDRQWHFHVFEILMCFIGWFLFKGRSKASHVPKRTRCSSSSCTGDPNSSRRRNSIDSTPRKKETPLPEKRTKDDLDVLSYKRNVDYGYTKTSNTEKMSKVSYICNFEKFCE